MLPREIRMELNEGKDTTLVEGLERLRKDVFERDDYDTVIVLDSHWASTVEFIVTSQERRHGLFTSEELPRGMHGVAFDYRGDPELAELPAGGASLLAELRHDRGTRPREDDDLGHAALGRAFLPDATTTEAANTPQVFVVIVLAVAAAEAAVGLSILLAVYRRWRTTSAGEIHLLRG